MLSSIITIALGAILINNFIFAQFLGIIIFTIKKYFFFSTFN